MGIIRFCLALVVISAHTHQLFPFISIDAFYAVKIFFVISGFYMALILNEKYFLIKDSYRLFITNRIIRLYPIYIIVFILSFLMYMFCYKLPVSADHRVIIGYNPNVDFILNFKYFLNHPGLGAYLLLSNLSMLGLDAIYFTHYPSFQIIPQAWTLSLEFYFYFMAPFLVRQRTFILLALFLASIYLRWWLLMSMGLNRDPWAYRFFPTEVVYFLLGIFSYRIYMKIRNFKIPKQVCMLVLFLILAPILDFKFLGFSNLMHYLYFLVLMAGLPLVFLFTKNSAFDRWIGEFSYPMYIMHFGVLYFVNRIMWISINDPAYGWEVVLGCLLVSGVLLYLVIYPVERIREKRVLSHKL